MAHTSLPFQRSMLLVLSSTCWILSACSSSNDGFVSVGSGGSTVGNTSVESNGGAGTGVGSDTGIDLGVGGTEGASTTTPSVWPPPQCETAPVDGALGAYCRGPLVVKAPDTPTNDNANDASGCGTTLWGVVRDFVSYRSDISVTSPDFGSYCCNVVKGMVAADLGADNNPVYTGVGATQNMMTDQAHFDQWYNDVADINEPYYVAFRLDSDGSGKYTFSASDASHQYFPVDGAGWGNDQNTSHNYSFTTEIHTKFVYRGGEVFTFTGDDDLWAFINRKLAIDIGGVHTATTESISLDEHKDELGIEIGGVYSLDLFGAERHPGESNFRIDTSMTFVDCGAEPPILQ